MKVTLNQGTTTPVAIEAGQSVSVAVSSAGAASVAIPGEGVAAPLAASASTAYGPYAVRREVIVNVSAGSVVIDVQNGAASASAVVGAQRTGVLSIKPWHPSGTQSTSYNGAFFMVQVKDGFVGARFGFRNSSTAATQTITAAVCSLPQIATDPKTITPITVTFAGSATGTIPQATTTTENGSTQTIDGYLLSDFVPITSVARTDVVGADPILYFRCESPQGIPYNTGNKTLSNYVAAYPSVLKCGIMFGTGAVSAWSTSTITDSGFLPYCEVDVYTGGRTCGISVHADSLAEGTVDSINYPLKMTPLLAALGIKAQVAQHAMSGRFRSTFSGVLRKVVPIKKPGIVIVHNYTVNSSVALTIDQQLGYLAGDIETITQNGGKPIIVCMHSNVGAATRTKAMYSGVYPIVDMNDLLNNPATGIIYPANTSDGTHLSDTGAGILAAAVVAEVAKLL